MDDDDFAFHVGAWVIIAVCVILGAVALLIPKALV